MAAAGGGAASGAGGGAASGAGAKAPAAAAPEAAAEGGKPLFPFVFVGCWNQPGAIKDEDVATARDAVAAAVVAQADIEHIVLGGDNVYARPFVLEDGKKNKKHEVSVFKEGIDLYRKSGKNIIGSFGNHNIDTLGHQMSEFKLTNTYYDRRFDNNIHLVVLNTNIIIENNKKPANYDGMLCWFRTTVDKLRESGHQYFVIQHEPYFSARSKDDKKKFGAMKNGEAFLDIMITYPPVAVLCADTHHYQHATIQKLTEDGNAVVGPIINQYIVGTGGANRDPYMDGFVDHSFGTYLFKKVAEAPKADGTPSFGFLRVDWSDIGAIRFVPVETPQGGGSRRHRRRQTNKRKQKRKSRRTRRHK